MTILQFHDDLPFNGLARAVAALVGAITVYLANRALTVGGVQLGTNQTKVGLDDPVWYSIGGKAHKLNDAGNIWTLSGATIPPNSWGKFALLVDDAQAPSVVAADPSSVSAAAVAFPGLNPIAALIALLTAGTGRAIIGTVSVATGATPFVPGTTSLADPSLTVVISDGLDTGALLPAVSGTAAYVTL